MPATCPSRDACVEVHPTAGSIRRAHWGRMTKRKIWVRRSARDWAAFPLRARYRPEPCAAEDLGDCRRCRQGQLPARPSPSREGNWTVSLPSARTERHRSRSRSAPGRGRCERAGRTSAAGSRTGASGEIDSAPITVPTAVPRVTSRPRPMFTDMPSSRLGLQCQRWTKAVGVVPLCRSPNGQPRPARPSTATDAVPGSGADTARQRGIAEGRGPDGRGPLDPRARRGRRPARARP